MLLFQPEKSEAQELEIARRAVNESALREPDQWLALARCPAVEAYTDGSAPVRNPGGPAGFAAILVGFETPVSPSSLERPEPTARLDMGAYVPARKSEPLTSNNRAEIAGIALALEAMRHLLQVGWAPRQAVIRSDSKYAVFCATGKWKRHKNTDLWPLYDLLAAHVRRAVPGGFRLEWVKGHAGNIYNEAADELATRAAFNFDEGEYVRFRAAQAATGREMPGEAAIARAGAEVAPAVAPVVAPGGWLGGADYVLVLNTMLDARGQANGYARATGAYRIWGKDGRSRQSTVEHSGSLLHDEAEYVTLIAALEDMVRRFDRASRSPGEYALTVYSSRDLVVKQLTGANKVRSAALQPPYERARSLLGRFKRATVLYKRPQEIEEMMADAPVC